jgi:hypothetical protein
MRNALKRSAHLDSKAVIAAEVERLRGMSLRDLRTAWAVAFRQEPPKGLWRDILLRSLAWRLHEKAFGGHDKGTLKLLGASEQRNGGDQRARRLKAGTILIREFGGDRHTVTILPKGFLWQDKTYSSLSAIARIITGTNWNGPRFFGLREGGGRKNGNAQRKAA